MGDDTAGPSPEVAGALTAAVAGERLGIAASLIRATGDWELAEDCLQDAVERALARWPADGVPDNPAAWLTTTARHRALDVLRRRRTETDKLRELMADDERDPAPVVALNRAAAVGFRDGLETGLHALQQVSFSGELAGYHLGAAVRAYLLRRCGRTGEALAAYREALVLVPTAAERRFLQRRVEELTGL